MAAPGSIVAKLAYDGIYFIAKTDAEEAGDGASHRCRSAIRAWSVVNELANWMERPVTIKLDPTISKAAAMGCRYPVAATAMPIALYVAAQIRFDPNQPHCSTAEFNRPGNRPSDHLT